MSKYTKDKYGDNLRHRRRNQEIILLAKSRPCMDCGHEFPAFVMDFDHRGDKLHNVSQMTNMGAVRLLAEIAKCDVVCANCHRIRTHSRDEA